MAPERGKYKIAVSAISFQREEKTFEYKGDSATFRLNFTLTTSVSFLDTVKVNSVLKIRQHGDTIVFNPNAFALKNETTIEQLLSRLPGIKIEEDGKISFNGTPVNSILLDGDDVFKKNYQQLTQNAAPEIIERVEIIKNYQRDKVLKEYNQTEGQVIDLRLKEKYKNYLFGYGAASVGTAKGKAADLFLMKLSAKNKFQFGSNYNTIGTTYSDGIVVDPSALAIRDNPNFFSYNKFSNQLQVDRLYLQNLPAFYQQLNKSWTGYSNTFLKRKRFELVVNTKFSHDSITQYQLSSFDFLNGQKLIHENNRYESIVSQEHTVSGAHIKDSQSLYFNLSFQGEVRSPFVNTLFNKQTLSDQSLHQNNIVLQGNLNYNKKLKGSTLWIITYGFAFQRLNESLKISPDFLFWQFPDNLTLFTLDSKLKYKVVQQRLLSSLLINRGRAQHRFDLSLQNNVFSKETSLSALKLFSDSALTPYRDENIIRSFPIRGTYSFHLLISKNVLSINLQNEVVPTTFRTGNVNLLKVQLLYDYQVGVGTRIGVSKLDGTIRLQRTWMDPSLLLTNPFVSSYHVLQYGIPQLYTTQKFISNLSHSVFSLKSQLFSYISANLSLNKDLYIRDIYTNGFYTKQSFFYYPNTTYNFFVVQSFQKLIHAYSLSILSNIIYNQRSNYFSFNQSLQESKLRSLSFSGGLKTSFKSFFNFEHTSSLTITRNRTMNTNLPSTSTNIITHKASFYFVFPHAFNSTITLNNVNSKTYSSNQYTFLDLLFSKVILKDRVRLEATGRNLLNVKQYRTQIIAPYFVEENLINLRGRQIILRLKYNFK